LSGFHGGNPHTMPLRVPAIAAAVAAVALFAAAPASAALHLSPIGTFTTPVYVTAPPADPHRVFVVEQAGRIMEVLDGVKQDTPFLDIRTDVKSGGEQGLLSMAFAPDYATSGRYYVYYTARRANDSSGSVITVEEFSPGERHVVFTVDHPVNGNHNGGQLQFGPDGLLYAATGDGGGGNDPPGNAQNLGSNLGKMLRIDPTSAGATPVIYAYGLRNPFRFSFDRQTGDLVIGDVGQSAREEVDFSAAGTAPGVDYGWVCREGSMQNPNASPQCTATGTVVDPVLEKNHTAVNSGGDGYCAIIGGYVVRDSTLTGLTGRYVYGDNCNTHVRSAALATPRVTDDSDTGLTVPGLSSFGEDSCGHVYVTALTGGAVSRIDGDNFTPCPEPSPGGGGGGTPQPGGGGGTPQPGGGGGTPQPGGGGGGNPGPVIDTRPPLVRLGALRRRSALRVRGFRVSISCDELCGATVTGRLRVRGMKRLFVLSRVARQVAAGHVVKVTLRPSGRALRALRSHRHGTVAFTVMARDSAGNTGLAKRQIRLVP
jgi:hypothetical protein